MTSKRQRSNKPSFCKIWCLHSGEH